MNTIVERETVIIHRSLNGITDWYQTLNLDFDPDQVVVRNVNYAGSGTGEVHAILVDFIESNEQLLCSFIDLSGGPYTSQPMSHFNISNFMLKNGTPLFRVNALTDSIDANTATGVITLNLEFLRHEEVRTGEVLIATMNEMKSMMVANSCVYPFCPPKVDVHPQNGGCIYPFCPASINVHPEPQPEESLTPQVQPKPDVKKPEEKKPEEKKSKE
jgi:hypothetical protein